MVRNREALREFWGRAKNDALELKKILEHRSGTATSTPHPSERDGVQEKAAPSKSSEADLGPDNGAANSKSAPSALTGEAAEKLRAALLIDLAHLRTCNDFETWARDAKGHIERLPEQMRSEVESESSIAAAAVPNDLRQQRIDDESFPSNRLMRTYSDELGKEIRGAQ